MISHLIGEEPADVGQHWDDSPDYSDLGLDEEDFADEETGDIDWGALEDEADYLREEWADQQRNNFAMNQIRRNIDMLQSVGDHLAGGGSMEPGTPIKDTGSIYRRSKMQVARPTARTVEQNSDLVQRVYQFGLPAEEGTDEPEAPKPRPFRNGQMRLPGTFQRRLP